jgi:hypothetical protein
MTLAQVELDRRDAENGELPEVCARCGAEAVVFKPTRLTYLPAWLWFVPVVGGPWGLLGLLLRRRVVVALPLCGRHQGLGFGRGLVLGAGFLGVVAVMGLAFAVSLHPPPDPLLPLAGWGPVLWGVAAVLAVGLWVTGVVWRLVGLRLTAVSANTLTLTNVSNEFADAAGLPVAEVEEPTPGRRPRGRRDEEPLDVLPVPEKGRRGRPLLWGLLAGTLALLMFGGCVAGLVWWSPWTTFQPPVELSNPRSSGLSFEKTYSVDYRFVRGGPEPGDRYFLVFVFDDGQRLESAVSVRERGKLSEAIRMMGRPRFGQRGPDQGAVEIFLEREVGAAGQGRRERASNVVSLR